MLKMIMATKRVKGHNGTEEDKEVESIFDDRISELPDEMIIKILSFLPTIDAVRMSLLSKRFRRIWTLIPVLNFSDSRDVHYFRRPNYEKNNERKKFFKFVDECLKHPFADTTITKFKLKMDFYGGGHRVDNWLKFPVKKNIQELDLHVSPARSIYCLPSNILCIRRLTLLKLDGVDLMTYFPVVNLPLLKVLDLANIGMDDQALNFLMLGCPSLEKFLVYNCYGLVNPQVLSLSLKYMKYNGGYRSSFQTIKIEAINLHSFIYTGGRGKCNINLVCCSAIRTLLLYEVSLTDQWLEDLIPKLPLLESLNLNSCFGLKHIKIKNENLRDLVFSYGYIFHRLDSVEATIDTPNLVSFSYTGYSIFKFSMNAPNLLYANVRIEGTPEKKTYDTEWYTSLINFLSELNGTENVHIFCYTEKALIIPNELREVYPSPLPDLKYLKVETGLRLFRKLIFRKSVLWISPSLETLSIE